MRRREAGESHRVVSGIWIVSFWSSFNHYIRVANIAQALHKPPLRQKRAMMRNRFATSTISRLVMG